MEDRKRPRERTNNRDRKRKGEKERDKRESRDDRGQILVMLMARQAWTRVLQAVARLLLFAISQKRLIN